MTGGLVIVFWLRLGFTEHLSDKIINTRSNSASPHHHQNWSYIIHYTLDRKKKFLAQHLPASSAHVWPVYLHIWADCGCFPAVLAASRKMKGFLFVRQSWSRCGGNIWQSCCTVRGPELGCGTGYILSQREISMWPKYGLDYLFILHFLFNIDHTRQDMKSTALFATMVFDHEF